MSIASRKVPGPKAVEPCRTWGWRWDKRGERDALSTAPDFHTIPTTIVSCVSIEKRV